MMFRDASCNPGHGGGGKQCNLKQYKNKVEESFPFWGQEGRFPPLPPAEDVPGHAMGES